MPSVHVFDMTLTRSDFRRLLPEALAGDVCEEAEDSFVHTEGLRTWRIDLEALPALTLGAIRLERYRVRWTFSGYEEAGIRTLLERFERAFQRGGG